MINVHWCNNVIRDYSSIREVSHFVIVTGSICIPTSVVDGVTAVVAVMALKVTSVMSRLTASPVAMDASKLVPAFVRTNAESSSEKITHSVT